MALLPPIARTRKSRLNLSRKAGAARASWSSNVPPTSPGPNKPMETVFADK
jgi:hypothetical protein